MITENLLSFSFSSFFFKVAVLFISYFTPIREIVHVMLIFLFIDTASGIWASLKSGERLESSKLRKTVYKFLLYTIAVMCSFMMEKTFGPSWLRLASIVGGFICSVELTSIFENIARITGDPIFRRLIKIIKKKSAETVQEVSQDENSEIKSGTQT